MTKTETARRLGSEHGSKRDVPYAPDGDVDYEPWPPGERYVNYVYWDAGSARLMDDLGETSETSESNWAERAALTRAYCEAYAAAAGIPFDTAG